LVGALLIIPMILGYSAWACSVAALGVVALGMRLLMSWAGMTR
jgi:hypothetical protein